MVFLNYLVIPACLFMFRDGRLKNCLKFWVCEWHLFALHVADRSILWHAVCPDSSSHTSSLRLMFVEYTHKRTKRAIQRTGCLAARTDKFTSLNGIQITLILLGGMVNRELAYLCRSVHAHNQHLLEKAFLQLTCSSEWLASKPAAGGETGLV